MKEEKRISQDDIDAARVRLGPIAGVAPRVYVPVLYALAILLVAFLVFMLPGIRRNGSVVTFQGFPAKAEILSDGRYIGSTGQSLYLKSGTYTLTFARTGFQSSAETVRIGGRLFGSLFFPRKQIVTYGLAQNGDDFLGEAFSEFSSYSLTGKPSSLYQLPPSLSDAAEAIVYTAKADGSAFSITGFDLSSFSKDALAASVSSESARDALRAGFLFGTGGVSGPLRLLASARTFLGAASTGTDGASWLADLLAQSKGSFAQKVKALTSKSDTGSAGSAPLASAGRFMADGIEFIAFKGGVVQVGGEAPSGSRLPYSAIVPDFAIASTEVTRSQWARFLAENPSWAKEAAKDLAAAGLADNSYLADWTGVRDDVPVTNVSWHAAQAYCAWLGSRLPGYQATLPSEAMWEAAARAGLSASDGDYSRNATWLGDTASGPARAAARGRSATGIADMFGNVWEWTQDSYFPYPAFASGVYSSGERAVRGGSWANKEGSVTLYSRGGLDPAHATPYLGFRPVLIKK